MMRIRTLVWAAVLVVLVVVGTVLGFDGGSRPTLELDEGEFL